MITAVFSDGGVVKVNPSPIAGTWAWCAIDERDRRVAHGSGIVRPRDLALFPLPEFPPFAPVTNNAMEYFALLNALRSLHSGWSGKVCTDSQVTLMRYFEMARNKGIPEEWIRGATAERRRLGTLEPVLLKGHPSRKLLDSGDPHYSEHQVWCDRECNLLAVKLCSENPWLISRYRTILRMNRRRTLKSGDVHRLASAVGE